MRTYDARLREIVFSLSDGFVWASWPQADVAVKLGTEDEVTAMMRDFIAQSELADRLGRGAHANR